MRKKSIGKFLLSATLICAMATGSIGINNVMAARALQTIVRVPAAPEKVVYKNASASIDASNVSEGYVMAKYTGKATKVKFQLKGSNGVVYNYNLTPGAAYEAFPLTSGNGKYNFSIFENIVDSKYALAIGQDVDVALANQNLPYLYPSQYVNYKQGSGVVKKGAELAATAADDLGVVQNVYNYVVSNITYDFDKAANVKSGYVPAVENVLSSGKGICFDYAAVMATMLRSQNIPTRLEVGYVGNGTYHAWVSIFITNVGWVDDVIQFDGKTWKLMDPTFAAGSKGSDQVKKFIGNGSNYSTKYLY